MKVALVSYNSLWLQPFKNIERCIEILAQACQKSCDLVIFPEMTFTGFSPEKGCLNSSEFEYCIKKLMFVARQHDVHVIFGALTNKFSESNAASNSAFLISPGKETIASYSKVHLFSFGNEHLFVAPGKHLSIFSISDIHFAPSICYDLRFPEIYSALASRVKCFINIASWPSQRIDHWYTLLKARAIENQAYMIGVNRSGIDGNNLVYEYSSSVYDPCGNKIPLSQSESCESLSFVEIDFSLVDKTRSEFHLLVDKRYGLYRSSFPDS